MPIIDKRDIHNWYNTIPINGAEARKWDHFSAATMKGNEIRCGAAVMAKIPNIPGRISRKKRESEDGQRVTTYIELILERRYDPVKKQTRNRRVTIGIDVNHIYPGMMIINDKYHDYFDHNGNLIYDPEGDKAQEELKREDAPAAQAKTKKGEEARPPENHETAEEPAEAEPARPDERRGTVPARQEETESMSDEAEAMATEAEINKIQHKKDRVRFLESMLQKYRFSISEQAKKRPDRKVSGYQVRRINEILTELRDYFQETDVSDYLELAEEPDEEGKGLTYADMEILLHAYACVLTEWWLDRPWRK